MFTGTPGIRLLGLPKHASAPPLEVDATATRLVFPVTVGRETPPAIHNTLYAELTTFTQGEPVVSYLGRGGVLEVSTEAAPRAAGSRLDVLRKARAGGKPSRAGD